MYVYTCVGLHKQHKFMTGCTGDVIRKIMLTPKIMTQMGIQQILQLSVSHSALYLESPGSYIGHETGYPATFTKVSSRQPTHHLTSCHQRLLPHPFHIIYHYISTLCSLSRR